MSNEMKINDSLENWSIVMDNLIKNIQQSTSDTKQSISEKLKDILGTVPEEPEDFLISQDFLDSLLKEASTKKI